MSIHSLPPELLHDIFRIAVDSFPQDDYLGANYRNNLRSFALVHRSWTSLAQSQLAKSIWLSSETVQNEKTFATLEKAPFDEMQTTQLYCHGAEVYLLGDVAVMGRFRRIKYLSIDINASIATIAKFPQLETIHVRNALLFLIDTADLSFPNLNRLVLSDSAGTNGDDPDYAAIFNARAMPKLAHLALDCHGLRGAEMLEPFIKHVLPLARSLAFNRSNFGSGDLKAYSMIMTEAQLSAKLEHLSVALDSEGLSLRILIEDSPNLKLKTLHLSGDELGKREKAEQLFMIGNEEHESVKVEKVVLYGKTRESPGHDYSAKELEAFTWVSRGGFRCGDFEMEYPPFEDFDGSYHFANLV